MQPVCESVKGKKKNIENPLNSFFFCCPGQWNFRSTLWLRKEIIISELRNYSLVGNNPSWTICQILQDDDLSDSLVELEANDLQFCISWHFSLPKQKNPSLVWNYTQIVWFHYLYKITPFESIFWQNTTTCMIHSTQNTDPKIAYLTTL